MKNTIQNSINNSYQYSEYRKIVSDLLANGKSSGLEQSDDLLHYSKLNETRMKRLDKTILVPETIVQQLQGLKKSYLWLVLAEGWCGDAAQLLPVIHKMAESVNTINLHIVFRDENEPLMQAFLTNGARSIPKLIIVNPENREVLAAWGPRPEGAARLIKEYKAKYGVVNEEAKTELQKWYLNDKGLSTMEEILKIIQVLE